MPVVLAVFLVVWGNVASSLLGASAILPGGSWAFVVSGALLTVIVLAIARRARLDPAEIGLARNGMLAGALVGGASAALVALAGVAILRLVAPAVVGGAVDYEPLRRVAPGALTLHILFFLPLGAVLPEELAFRGVLFGMLRRASARAAVLGSAAVFALWHLAVAVVTVGDTTVGPPSIWFVPAIAGALLVVFGGGIVFALLRLRTGTLASTVAAHWIFNATVLVGLSSTMTALRGV